MKSIQDLLHEVCTSPPLSQSQALFETWYLYPNPKLLVSTEFPLKPVVMWWHGGHGMAPGSINGDHHCSMHPKPGDDYHAHHH